MKIAVYTICKNEEAFVDRWLDSVKGADYILVADTGSTDSTIQKFKDRSDVPVDIKEVSVVPFRFDIARNYSLFSIPSDIDVCICLDMDEVLVGDWRKIIEDAWEVDLDRLRYNYIWSWNEDNTPGLTYYADKIHARHGFRWKHPVHEVLVQDGRLGDEIQKFIDETLIEHHADNSKPRSQYLHLLKLAVDEDPLDDRNAHYYARELLMYGRYQEAVAEFTRHLSLPRAKWKPERAASYRYLGDCYWALGDITSAIESFDEAIIEAPNEREAYVSMAQVYRHLEEWELVIFYCEKALAITERPNTYINTQVAWSDWPNQMLNEAKEMLNGKEATG